MDLATALHEAVVKTLDEHYQATTAQNKVLRAPMIDQDTEYVEVFPIRVAHTGHHKGRNARVSMDGCPLVFTIEQAQPQRKDRWQPKLDMAPSWEVSVGTGIPDRWGYSQDQKVETTEDFQSAVQKCIVSLMGHVYYDGVA